MNEKLDNLTSLRQKCNSAIILAGGLGTRLRSVITDLPKCMAPVNGTPFLGYVIRHLQSEGISEFIFSVGYLHESIVEYVNKIPGIISRFSIEEEPLGTGGGIRMACGMVKDKTVLVCNGDTLFNIDIIKLLADHERFSADCSLSLKLMTNFDRYGVVELNTDFSVKLFKEKQWYDSGLINGGVYAINVLQFLKEDLPNKFSFEKDYLEKYYSSRRLFGVIQDKYFIDIGIPADYQLAQQELEPF